MSEPSPIVRERSYGCTFGCGNPYDFVVITVEDSTTEFLCLPCFVRLAMDMVAAVTDSDDPKVKAALSEDVTPVVAKTANSMIKPRGKNAPVTADDDDLISEFQSVITVDELPEEFR